MRLAEFIAKHHDEIVREWVDFARGIQPATAEMTEAPADLGAVCRPVVTELEAFHSDAALRLEVKGDVQGEWDADRLAQVASNLVANAVQHGRAGSPVRVVAEGEGDEVVLRVQNEGTPIPPDAIASVFEPMVRVPDRAETHSTSLGLGLYIAHEVVTAHGGTIGVTSTAAEGTTFTVRLPRRLPPAATPPGVRAGK